MPEKKTIICYLYKRIKRNSLNLTVNFPKKKKKNKFRVCSIATMELQTQIINIICQKYRIYNKINLGQTQVIQILQCNFKTLETKATNYSDFQLI